MSSRTLFKLFSSVMVMAVVLSLTGSPALAGTQTASSKPPVQSLSEIGTPASDQEIAAIQARQDGTVRVMLEMVDPPTALVYSQALQQRGRSSAATSALAAFSQIKRSQQEMIQAMSALNTGASVIYQAHAAYNGVAVSVNSNQLKALKTLPGLKAIHALIPKSLDNSESVPFINAPYLWQLGLGGTSGDGIKVGVIDTGIDYLHTDFGGPGAGYNLIDFTTIGGPDDPYPTAKVAGGWDFVGDDYNADDAVPIIAPDPNPMDCGAHGSHVSGTVAGYGVNSDGSTYTGNYGEGTDFASMRIGPGVAPKATLYGLRVFGCEGTTDVVVEAIDWAVDPNMDGDPSDHLDVINMSLGSSFGSPYDSDAVASDNAVEAGVIVVASAGNAYDTHYITGSPAAATRAISVASSVGEVAYAGFLVNSSSTPAIEGVYQASPGSPSNVVDPGVTADLKLAPDETLLVNAAMYTAPFGCSAAPVDYYLGKIAMVARGSCSFYTKAFNAQTAGAVGLIVYNHVSYVAGGDPTVTMAMSGAPAITIPNMHLTNANGQPIADVLGAAGTVNGTIAFSTRFVPAVSQADTISGFSSRGGRRYDNFLKPDIAAPGDNIVSVSALTGDQGEFLSGTSMASPHIAGVMALLRQLHPSWSVEELKALVMNTATHDLTTDPLGAGSQYTPARIGAGRVDVKNASQSLVVAYNAEDAGAVSLSFGVADVPVDQTAFVLSKQFKLENKGGMLAEPVTYDVSYEAAPSWAVDGVVYEVVDSMGDPVTEVTVNPGQTVTLTVKLTIDGSMLKHTMDASMATSQNGGSRNYMTESGGLIELEPQSGSTQALRLPVYAAVRPMSKMTATASSLALPLGLSSTSIKLSGTGIDQGNANTPEDISSLVSALELKYVGTDMQLGPEAASGNIQYAGVMSDISGEGNLMANTWLFFGVSTFGKWSTASASDTEFDIWIDTDADGIPDFVAWNTSLKDAAGNSSDAFVSVVYDLNLDISYIQSYINGIAGDELDTNLYNNNVMVIPVKASRLGLTDADATFNFWIDSYTREADFVEEIGGADGIPYDAKNLAVDTSDGVPGSPIWYDLPGEELAVAYNAANEGPEGVMGVLLLHHHNQFPDTAQVVTLLTKNFYLPVISQSTVP